MTVEQFPQRSEFDRWAPTFRERGFWPRRVTPGSKGPDGCTGWNGDGPDHPPMRIDPKADYGIGLLMGSPLRDGNRLAALDVDHNHYLAVARALLRDPPSGRIGSKGAAFFVRVEGDERSASYKVKSRPAEGLDWKSQYPKAVAEVLFRDVNEKQGDHRGKFCVIPPTIHKDTGRPYEWIGTPLHEIEDLSALPALSFGFAKAVFTSEFLPILFGGDGTHDAAMKFVAQLVAHTDDDTHIEQIVRAALPDDYRGDTLDELPELIRSARKKGFDAPPEQADGGAPFLSDDHLTQEYVARHGHEMRFVAEWGKWMVWDGACWRKDDKLASFERARIVCRDLARQAKSKSVARSVSSTKTRAAVVSMAQGDAVIAASIDQWDADPMLLNTPTCVVDLRTGAMRAHDPKDYMTKSCAVGPDPECPIPLFTKFLRHITDGNEELIRYWQRRDGYSLTGVTIEHKLFFNFGSGRNGKGTLLSTTAGIMGDYHRVIPMEALMVSYSDRHPTELAGLVGARMVSASETKTGSSWNEAMIKTLTGGDKIPARLMRQDFFDFTPQFKLHIFGNSKPNLREVDVAMRARLQLSPFTVFIPEEERDTQLLDKLKAEWPGILWWMIEGCLEWQRIGLAAPQIVLDATNDYLEAQDNLEAWMDECCDRVPGATEQSSALFFSWRGWMEARNEKPGHQRLFNDKLEKVAEVKKKPRTEAGILFSGLRLKPIEQNASQPAGRPGIGADPSMRRPKVNAGS